MIRKGGVPTTTVAVKPRHTNAYESDAICHGSTQDRGPRRSLECVQDLLADCGKEKIEIEQGVLGEESVPDEVLARVLEASQVIDDEPALQLLEDGDLYIGYRLRGGPLAFAVILRLAQQTVVGIETFDLRLPIDPETNERMVPVPPADPEGERNAILEEVRPKFDRTLKSDYRSLNDMLDWAALLLRTTEFRRTVSLVAEAIATRPAQSRSTNIIRLVQQSEPGLASAGAIGAMGSRSCSIRANPSTGDGTAHRRSRALCDLRETYPGADHQLSRSGALKRVSGTHRPGHTDGIRVTYIGSLGPEIPSFLQNTQLHAPRGIEALREASNGP